MIETTETTVATPMITPRSVRNERSLLRRSACNGDGEDLSREACQLAEPEASAPFFSFSILTLSPSFNVRRVLKGPVMISWPLASPSVTSTFSSPARPSWTGRNFAFPSSQDVDA